MAAECSGQELVTRIDWRKVQVQLEEQTRPEAMQRYARWKGMYKREVGPATHKKAEEGAEYAKVNPKSAKDTRGGYSGPMEAPVLAEEVCSGVEVVSP